ncbi:MAG: cytochrome C [Deltaproteobacteria bacterium]|nr:cytochrome C [Deltaproteobacteria bacterium]
MLKGCRLTFFFFLISMVFFAVEQAQAGLREDDCAKCHPFQLQTLAAEGGKHATEVGCLDCHPEHPPKGENTISACVLCHEGKPHFEIDYCLDCHANPHKPLASLRDTMKSMRTECLTCHAEVGQQMAAATSRHAELFCTNCHDRHGFIPSCLACHAPHLPVQTDADCFKCHRQAHGPLQVEPAASLPSAFCQPCHDKETRDLAGTTTYHGALSCVYCHNGPHPAMPRCQDCHGLPHANKLNHSQYRLCLNCHGNAHRLIRNP